MAVHRPAHRQSSRIGLERPGRPSDLANQLHALSREVPLRQCVEPELARLQQTTGAGLVSDALIPFTDPSTGKPLFGAPLTALPCEVKAGVNQPFWVDLEVPRSAEPGEYAGTYTVTSDQGSVTGPISLTVWNFALPKTPYLKSSFLFFQVSTLAAQRGAVAQQSGSAVHLPERSAVPNERLRLGRHEHRTLQRSRYRELRNVTRTLGRTIQGSGGSAATGSIPLRLQR